LARGLGAVPRLDGLYLARRDQGRHRAGQLRLARLPKSGDVWSEADRKLWLNLLEGSFKLIYKDKDAPPSDGQHEAER
jgi:hypothetical protein